MYKLFAWHCDSRQGGMSPFIEASTKRRKLIVGKDQNGLCSNILGLIQFVKDQLNFLAALLKRTITTVLLERHFHIYTSLVRSFPMLEWHTIPSIKVGTLWLSVITSRNWATQPVAAIFYLNSSLGSIGTVRLQTNNPICPKLQC
jgi:hypothetical protein